MQFPRFALPPRGLLALIVGLTLVPLALLAWLGWRALEQERALESQQARQQLEFAADLVTSALQRIVAADTQRLATDQYTWPAHAAFVSFHETLVEPSPAGRVAYLPVVPALPEAEGPAFAKGEALEFRQGDRAAAALAFRELAGSSNLAVRAGALLRLGRNLASLGRRQDALDVYAQLCQVDGVSVAGVPAAIAARYARAALFEQERREADLSAEAQRLGDELREGRWALTRPVYMLYLGDATRWGAVAPQRGPTEAEWFAEAVQQLWQKRSLMPAVGQDVVRIGDHPVTVVWTTSAGTVRILIVGPEYAESRWFGPARALAAGHHVTLDIRDTAGSLVRFGIGSQLGHSVVRRAADTGLPWQLGIGPAGPPPLQQAFAQRRKLLVAGFGLLVLLSLLAMFLILRSVSRELAVARLQSDFVAAVSHEFRTPLTSLRQFTDMLRDQSELGDDRRRVCYAAQSRATDRLTRLVESLLDFGRMEAGALEYRFERQDGSALVRRVVEDFRRERDETGHTIQCSTDGGVQIDADVEALSRAVGNLLDNAVKYSPNRGDITVSTHRRARHFRIAVEDHGIGIPAHERQAILTKFRRGEQAAKLGIKGTGIGLAMVRQIVAAHGGRLEIQSEPGRGSVFTIVLPVKE
ncbi:MAG: ATP-binding protein [Bacteroidales bacterium]